MSDAEVELERIRTRERERLRRWRAAHPEMRKAASQRREAKRRQLRDRYRAEYDEYLSRGVGAKEAFRLLLNEHRDDWGRL